jgi:hypothetical protein
VDLEVLGQGEGHEDEHDGHDDEEFDEGEACFVVVVVPVEFHGGDVFPRRSFAWVLPSGFPFKTLSVDVPMGQMFASLPWDEKAYLRG